MNFSKNVIFSIFCHRIFLPHVVLGTLHVPEHGTKGRQNGYFWFSFGDYRIYVILFQWAFLFFAAEKTTCCKKWMFAACCSNPHCCCSNFKFGRSIRLPKGMFHVKLHLNPSSTFLDIEICNKLVYSAAFCSNLRIWACCAPSDSKEVVIGHYNFKFHVSRWKISVLKKTLMTVKVAAACSKGESCCRCRKLSRMLQETSRIC